MSAPIPLSQEQITFLARLRTNNQLYNRHCLKIRTDQGVVAMVDNEAQDYIEYRAEEQLRRQGKVRQVIVKGRQQGASEKVSSRGFKKATQQAGYTVFILSCQAASTQVLFGKVERYYRLLPNLPGIKPGLRASNRNQIKFDNESEYTVGTAGNDDAGVSNTIQFCHISEAAIIKDDTSLKTGLLQTVSDAPGTEIWFETTARGKNWFYHFVRKINAGEIPDYEVTFIPWYWSGKYRAQPLPGFERSQEEKQLSDRAYVFNKITKRLESRPLDDAQLQWRRNKIATLGEKIFKQEYPSYLEEAFQASGECFHDGELVEQAMNTTIDDADVCMSPIVLGLDTGRTTDRTVFTWRQGRKIRKFKKIDNKKDPQDTQQLAGICINELQSGRVDYIMLDIAYAHGVYDALVAAGWGDRVFAINFGNKADYDPIYKNKRAEMAFEFDAWLREQPVSLPNDPDMSADIASMPPPKNDANGLIVFPPKEKIADDLGHSPDILDSIYLTFAKRVRLSASSVTTELRGVRDVARQEKHVVGGSTGSLSTSRRRQEFDQWMGVGGSNNGSGSSGWGQPTRGRLGHRSS